MNQTKHKSRTLRCIAGLLLFLLLLSTFVSCNPADLFRNPLGTTTEQPDTTPGPLPEGTLQVFFIDVGQADSILVLTPNRKSILIDAGDTSTASKEAIKTCLTEQGITTLDYAIFTHPHADHIGGAAKTLNSFPALNVLMPDRTATTASYNNMLDAIEDCGATLTIPEPGSTYTLDGVTFRVLAPNSTTYNDDNNFSIVIRLVFGNTSFLFTGDAEGESEEEMVSLYSAAELQSTVLKVGHHGSNSSCSSAFLAKVQPQYAIISCGEGNRYGHPTAEALGRLSAAGVPVYRTDLQGEIVMQSDGATVSFVD